MSNSLAIAAVTAVLKDLITGATINNKATEILNSDISVTTLPPDRIITGENEQSQLNLFLYNVASNPGWKNVDLPSRNDRGERISNPPLALDLYYLLSAYGKDNYDDEILLGYAMQLLHETPVLTRDAIRETLASHSSENSVKLNAIADSGLADQIEMVKICFHPLNTEEMSKLWTAFQAKYRPSAAYHVSVILIESEHPARSPLPVLTRGGFDPILGRETGVIVTPDLVPPVPTLQNVNLPHNQISARINDTIVLNGHHLDGSEIKIHFTNPRRHIALEANPLDGNTPGSISVQLNAVTDYLESWGAGFYNVRVHLRRPGETGCRDSNELSFSLAPTIKSTAVVKDADNEFTFAVKFEPEIRPEQSVTLIVGEYEISAQPCAAATSTLTFKITFPPEMHISGNTYYARLRVDGVDSILIDRSKTPPVFDASQQIVMP